MQFPRGSEWRKWDLQVQTRMDAGYKCLGKDHCPAGDDLEKLKALSGLTEAEITGQEKQIAADKYARLYLSYTQLFTDIKVLGITDHNRGDELDFFIKESQNFDVSIIPGVEVSSAQGIHMLCLFDPTNPWKKNWARTIEDLMTELNCPKPFNDQNQPANCDDTCQKILDKVGEHGGLVIFPHIGTENGLFYKFSTTASGGSVHIDIYKHALCRAVQIPSTGNLNEGTRNVIEGKDANYGSKIAAKFRCSDSRNLKEIGSAFTWVKANPTFQGLQQAIEESGERLSLSPKPDLLKRIELNSTKVIERILVNKQPNSDLKKEDWFVNCDVPLNPGMVAIIGNKGSGKSALADIIGLMGCSKQHPDFSFLNVKKFKSGKKAKASHFDAKIIWWNTDSAEMCINDLPPENSPEKLKYIPQHYLEKICNDVDVSTKSAFDEEIQDVIFSHVEYEERLGQPSLEELIKVKTKQIDSKCTLLREKVSDVNAQIIELENKLSKKSRDALDLKITEKEEQLASIKSPDVVEPPVETPESQKLNQVSVDKLKIVREDAQKLESLQKATLHQIAELNAKIVSLKNIKSDIENYASRSIEFKQKITIALTPFQIDASKLFKLETDMGDLDAALTKLETDLGEEKKKLFNEKSENLIQPQIDAKAEEMRFLEQELDAPNRKYQAYLKEIESWKKKKEEIEGDVTIVGSLKNLKATKANLNTHTAKLKELIEERFMLSTQIFSEISELQGEYQKLYAPIQNFMEAAKAKNNAKDKSEIELSFSASIVFTDFSGTFLNYLNRSKSGNFRGSEEGQKKVNEILNTSDFQTANGTRLFLNSLVKALSDSDDTVSARVIEQLSNPAKILEFFNYIFSLQFLVPKYELMWSGKKLEELSPGERGCMLLVFYLLLDKRDYPLIIDQPEENLDNQTIFKILVPCVRKAKNSRQIIVVTHNPNIAVNCDADQIICASIDKKKKNKVIYVSGAIEDEGIRNQIIDILEGTIPAFVKRSGTYRIKPSSTNKE